MKTRYNRTKIVATIGPASSTKEVITELITAGMSVARLNFSHDTHESHKRTINHIKEINEATGKNVAILADLQGPKIRIGEVENSAIALKANSEVTLMSGKDKSTVNSLYISYEGLNNDVKVGEKILIDDGKINLEVIEVNNNIVKAKVIYGGMLTSNKGVNFPNTITKLSCLTPKDLRDLDFIIENDLEWVALSFVRTEDDIIQLKNILKQRNADIKIVAKIEKPEAVKNIDKIIEVSDGIMVARGDLGVEMSMDQVPIVQKQIVQKCIKAAKPVIIATQMLQSMLENPTPSRAEINDVANSVIDGSDAVMLSNETAVGLYPVKAVEAMYTTIKSIERDYYNYNININSIAKVSLDTSADSVCASACQIADQVKAVALVGMTWSGYTALKLSSHRPRSFIYIFTANSKLLRTLSLVWGVRTFNYSNIDANTDTTVQEVNAFLQQMGLIQVEDIIINTFAAPLKAKLRTNSIRITKIS
ncbi:MAG: pyruvate kinase [Solitalea-like symbiont of Acarus siro]